MSRPRHAAPIQPTQYAAIILFAVWFAVCLLASVNLLFGGHRSMTCCLSPPDFEPKRRRVHQTLPPAKLTQPVGPLEGTGGLPLRLVP